MKKTLKIIAITLVSILLLLAVSLIVLLALGYRFNARSAVHSFYRNGESIHSGKYDFWLHDVVDEDGSPIYALGHVAVKKYGFLYKQLEEKDRRVLINEYGDYVGTITRYKDEATDHYFIHWVQSVTGIVDGKYTQSMRYYSEKIEINGREVELFAHCYFELGECIEELIIKGEKITVVDEWKKPPVSLYAPRPDDAVLEFWITENVENADLSQNCEIYGWMGAREFLGKGYQTVIDENGNQVKPKHCVSYLLTAYPDYSDGGEYVTQIDITDPDVSVYGLTVNSTFEEYDGVFRKMGYVIEIQSDGEGKNRRFVATKYDSITFIFYEGNANVENAVPKLTVKAKVTNKEGIHF